MDETESTPTPEDAHAAEFARLAGAPEGALDLGRAALAIGRIAEPELVVEEYAARLDVLAERVTAACGTEAEAARVAAAASEVLFREEGFAGDRTDYYNPQNSFLHDVLERRRGLPILLSVLFMEVAGRAGLAVEGVGAPSHFVVRYRADDQWQFLDPFSGGEAIPRAVLEARVEQALAGTSVSTEAFLEGVTARQILSRILVNLKGCYARRGDATGALAATDYLLAMTPWAVEEVRDRGLLLYQLHRYDESLDALRRYVEHAPESAQVEPLERLIGQIEEILAQEG